MISVYGLKPAFQKLLQPALRGLRKVGVSPNQITIVSVLLSIAMGYGVLQHQQHPIALLLVPIGYLFRMGLNALDGMMARQYHMQSQLGEVLNELGDVVSDIAIIFPFVIVPGISPVIIVAFGVLAILNEFAGLLGKALGKERRYDGPMGKSDRALFIALYCLVAYFWVGIEVYANALFGVAAGLVVLSTLIRLQKAL